MSDELARIRERLVQNRNALRNEQFERAETPPNSNALSGASFLPGDRVFDTVSGLEGEVLGRTAENIIISTS